MNARRGLDRGALLAAVVTAVGWGLTGVVIRLLPPVSPISVTAARLLVASLITLPVLCILVGADRSVWRVWRQPSAYGLGALLAGYYWLATAAFQLAPVAEVALLLSTPPLYVVIWYQLSGGRPGRGEIGGAVVAIAGLGLLLAPQWTMPTQDPGARVTGDVLALCASALVAIYALYYRAMEARACAPHVGGVMLLTFVMGASLLGMLQAVALEAVPGMGFDPSDLPLLVVLGALCTALPSAAYAFASKRLPAVVTTSISLLLPLLAALFAFLLLDESVPPTAVPGAALVLAGIGLILRRGRSR